MKKNNIGRIILIVIAAGLVLASFIYLYSLTLDTETELKASGTVETVELYIAPEIAGIVTSVEVEEGQQVSEGDILFTLDAELLEKQKSGAEAALETAKANLEAAKASESIARASLESVQLQYEQVLNSARMEELPIRSTAWLVEQPEEITLPAWYFVKDEKINAAAAEVDAAAEALQLEEENFVKIISESSQTDFAALEQEYAEKQAAFLVAEEILNQAEAQDDEEITEYAQELYDSALAELESVQTEYEQILTDQNAQEVNEARARLSVAKQRYEIALDFWYQQQTGDESLAVQAAASSLDQAQAALVQAQAAVTLAEKSTAQAQTQIDLINAQLDNTVIRSPMNGTVLTRSIEPGEFLQPGASVIKLGQLDQLTITVYVTEDRYGSISLNQKVEVYADSFPNEVFEAVVIRIADEAEYTPRNVQTEDGRKTTVFAIKVMVEDTDGKLKPGMPADVTFIED